MGAIDARLTPWARQLGPAMARDLAVWKNLDRPYLDEVKALRTWTDTRLRWMDSNLPGSCP